MEDVTSRVLEGVTEDMDAAKRDAIINANITEINAEAVKGTHYRSAVRPFFMGNQYFLIVSEVFGASGLEPAAMAGSFRRAVEMAEKMIRNSTRS
jgi:hypothetical protein